MRHMAVRTRPPTRHPHVTWRRIGTHTIPTDRGAACEFARKRHRPAHSAVQLVRYRHDCALQLW